jgi:integrase
MNLRPNDPTAPAIQVTIKNILLPTKGGLLYRTFRTDPHASAYEKARAWGEPIEAALSQGNVPANLLKPESVRERNVKDNPSFFQMLRDYEAQPHAKISASFKEIAGQLLKELDKVSYAEMTMDWVHDRLDFYKDVKEYAPGTIRKRIETLSVIHAYTKQQFVGDAKFVTICDQLPMNYARREDDAPEETDLERVAHRPLTKEREAAIRAVFSGEKQIAPASVATLRDPKLNVLFTLISNTGLRLQEAYLLRVSDLDFKNFVVQVRGSKGWHGVIKQRTTFIRKVVREALQGHIAANNLTHDDYLFREGWWDGDCMSESKIERKRARKKTSSYLSGLFRSLYKAAGIDGLREHDLRHEATIRFIEMEQDGKPVYNREDLKKMMGWTSEKMVSHYLSKWRPEIGSSRVSADL